MIRERQQKKLWGNLKFLSLYHKYLLLLDMLCIDY